MRLISLYAAAILVVTLMPDPRLAQQKNTNASTDLWRVRSQSITTDLIKDSSDLIPTQRALLLAGLAQRWWQDDPEQARSWIAKAIDIVEEVPNKENADEHERRISAVRSISKIMAPLDQKLTARLIAILSKDAEESAKGKNTPNTDGLIEAAMLLVEKDPSRARELGSMALRLGRSNQITSLIARLRPQEPKLADSLFAETIAAVKQSLDRELLISLAQLAFPVSMKSGTTIGAPPDNLRVELLKLDVIFIQSNPITPENKDFNCISVASFIAPVLDQFERLLPEQAAVARQSVSQCQSTRPLMGQSGDDALNGRPLNTVDELLKAADEAKDVRISTVYQYRAAMLARQHNDFEGALKILDSMSLEARKFMGGSWEAYRSDWAVTAALEQLKNGDIFGMRNTMKAIPDDLQIFSKIGFLRRLPANSNAETDPTAEFINDTLQNLHGSSLSDSDKSTAYFALLPIVVKFQPAAASNVLKEGVAALNRVEGAKGQNTNDNQRDNFFEGEFTKNLPATLFDMDQSVVNEAVSSINSRNLRIQIRFELLTVCLDRLRSIKQPVQKQAESGSKGE